MPTANDNPENRNMPRSPDPESHECPIWALPGTDGFPDPGPRDNMFINPLNFVPANVRGDLFFLPSLLLINYPFWNFLCTPLAPGNSHVLNLDPTIFSVLLEAVMLGGPFAGTEPGLNLPLLLSAYRLASDLEMDRETNLLGWSTMSYIVKRIFKVNPWNPPANVLLDHNYFTYRSEEIYRAWLLVRAFPQFQTDGLLSEDDLVLLFVYTVPEDIWPALTVDFDDDFHARITELLNSLPEGPAPDFQALFEIFLHRSVNNGWFVLPPLPGISIEIFINVASPAS